MRFDKKNPRFLVDLITMILALIIISLTLAVILGGFESLLAVIFYFGAAMFAANIVRGIISHNYIAILLILPVALCIAGGLVTQGVIRPWIF